MIKMKFFVGIFLTVILASILVEGRTELSNCIEICTDTTGCTCPGHCTVTGNINQNTNCGGQVTSCAKENKKYWIRDGNCQATCGDYDDEFMISKGWTVVDYNCYSEEPPITEEPSEEIEKLSEEITEEPIIGQLEVEKGFLLYINVALTVIAILLIFWLIFRKKKRELLKK